MTNCALKPVKPVKFTKTKIFKYFPNPYNVNKQKKLIFTHKYDADLPCNKSFIERF